ncbi:MAG: hypothetical protein NTY93_02245 [Candidatus Kaiserbacteria bacterium]|nr:hypothetical protein [Candidatus Kaiserbacteria bacterium]MCX6794102.1 hypothetical protein [Candidatus Gottesmanbacteria bacterium]
MKNSQRGFVMPLLLAIIAILLIGGGAYVYMQNKQTNQPATTNSVAQITQSDELVQAKFELAILKFWQVKEVFRNPQNENQFYYMLNSSGGGSDIFVYDLTKDKTYQQNGTINPLEGNTLLFNQKLAQNQEFRGVGIVDNKFVFVETSSDNSLGPCFSHWFYQNLQYIDLGISNPTRKSFTLPENLKTTEKQKELVCQTENSLI